MPTLNLDILNQDLAVLIGDPRTENGVSVAAGDNGIAYSSADRDRAITEALRMLLNTLGHDFLENTGFAQNYTLSVSVTSAAFVIPATITRIFMVTYRDERTRFLPLGEQAKFNNILTAHNTISWRVDDTGKLIIYNIPDATWPTGFVLAKGIKPIPALTHNGTSDVEISSYYFPLLLRYAEVIARRNHQETQAFIAQKMKETDDQTIRFVNTEGEKWH
jgi:hypothetical protein